MKFEYETPEMSVVEMVSRDVFVALSGGNEGDFGDTEW